MKKNNNVISEFERTDREEFIEKVIAELKKELDSGISIERKEQLKNNSTRLEGIIIKRPDSKVAPAIYLNSFYERYVKGEPFMLLIEELLDCYELAMGANCPSEDVLDISRSELLSKIFYKLVNHEANEELLSGVPHRDYLDFALTYHWQVTDAPSAFSSVTITHELAQRFDLDEETLYKAAAENTPRLFPFKLHTMAKAIGSLMGLEQDSLPDMFGGIEDYPMFVVSNERLQNGASVLMYEEFREEITEVFPEGFYVIPSSIHELIILPLGNNAEELLRIIHEVNATQVPKEEFLSDNLYSYNPVLESLEIVGQIE